MLIYNTTYQVSSADAQNLVIYLHEQFLPAAEASGDVKNPHLRRILSHQDPDSECFSLQFEVESSAILHRWYTNVGSKLNDELLKVFKDKVVGFPTLMEEIF